MRFFILFYSSLLYSVSLKCKNNIYIHKYTRRYSYKRGRKKWMKKNIKTKWISIKRTKLISFHRRNSRNKIYVFLMNEEPYKHSSAHDFSETYTHTLHVYTNTYNKTTIYHFTISFLTWVHHSLQEVAACVFVCVQNSFFLYQQKTRNRIFTYLHINIEK